MFLWINLQAGEPLVQIREVGQLGRDLLSALVLPVK
jgi:hypothetical protein